ncbi:MAG TPA: BON domain-containing protein [Steroidobacteraceae bacterium]
MTLIRAGALSPVKFVLLVGIITFLAGLGAGSTIAQNTAPAADSLTSIVVRAQRLSNYTDNQVTEQVESALRSDRYVDDAHVTATTENGVVTLHGFVQDAWDLLALRRIARKVSGVKKIVNDVELVLNDQ